MTTTGIQRWCRTVLGACVMLAGATSAGAQAQTPATAPPAPADATRPATTTFLGDTGLWYVPDRGGAAAQALVGQRLLLEHRSRSRLHRHRATSSARSATASAIAPSCSCRCGSRRASTATSVRSASSPTPPAGRSTNIRAMQDGWSGTTFGDVFAGGKFNILSEYAQAPVALAVRGVVKLPTGQRRLRQGHVDRQARLPRRRHRQQGNQQGVRGLRLRRLHGPRPARSRRRRPAPTRSRTACAGASASACRRAARSA